MRTLRVLTVVVALACLAPASTAVAADAAPSGHRYALLIGNAKYKGFTLAGVSKSLDVVEASLKASGYRIIRRENLGEKEFESAAEEFAQSVPTGGVALVYYAGLGAHVERLGKTYNLLRPVDAEIRNENEYRDRGVNLNELLETLSEQGGSRANLIFLDACWQSPLKAEADRVGAGLSKFDVGPDSLVVFAAESGKALPPPKDDSPTPLAKAVAKHVSLFDESAAKASQAIAADLNGWSGGGLTAGLGPPSSLPVAEELREGKTPGEGYVNSVGMTFRWCPPGSYTMGSPEHDSPDTQDRKPVEVTLTQGFWMGEHEVTQREYQAVMRKNVPRGFTVGKNIPFWGATEAKSVTQFCEKLNELERKAGRLPKGWEYAAPTEAQWEYACRAGSTARFCYGDDVTKLGEYGNFADKALAEENPNYHWAERRTDDGVGEALAPVGSYRPNAWGIRDMHGNVVEIVADHLTPERPGGKDPLVQLDKNGVTQIRGGAWCSSGLYCESSFRNGAPWREKLNFVGFRIVLQKTK